MGKIKKLSLSDKGINISRFKVCREYKFAKLIHILDNEPIPFCIPLNNIFIIRFLNIKDEYKFYKRKT